MKATRTTRLLLACLATPAAYAITPQVGGNDNNIGAIDGNDYSTTSRLNGEVLFTTRSLLGENDIGEAALFGNAGRLQLSFNYDPSDEVLADQAAPPQLLRVFGGVGRNENVQEWINMGDTSGFAFFGGDIGTSVSNGPLDVIAGVGGALTYYDEDLDFRQEDENWVPDVYGSIGARYTFSDSLRAKLFARGYYGGNASVGRDFVRAGVTSENYFHWDLDFGVDGRFDGAPLGDQGLEWSANFGWGGLEENSDGPSGSQLNNHDLNFRGEGRYNINGDTTLFAAGSYGHREFGDWSELNSHNYRVGGGGRVRWGDNFSWGGEAGVEFREYDDISSPGDDEQTEFYINGDAQWTPFDKLSIGVYADYGIQEFNINESPSGAFVDPLGVRAALRGRYLWNETTSIGGQINVTRVHGSEVVNPIYDDEDFFRMACGCSVSHMLNDRVELFWEGEYVQLDNDHDDDGYFNAALGARVGF